MKYVVQFSVQILEQPEKDKMHAPTVVGLRMHQDYMIEATTFLEIASILSRIHDAVAVSTRHCT